MYFLQQQGKATYSSWQDYNVPWPCSYLLVYISLPVEYVYEYGNGNIYVYVINDAVSGGYNCTVLNLQMDLSQFTVDTSTQPQSVRQPHSKQATQHIQTTCTLYHSIVFRAWLLTAPIILVRQYIDHDRGNQRYDLPEMYNND